MLRRITKHELPVHSPVDGELAEPLLWCSDGNFEQAELEILRVLKENLILLERDNEIFISIINAAFVVQRLDLVAAMLQDRYGFPGPLTIVVAPEGSGVGLIRWEILPSSEGGGCRFTFDSRAYVGDDTRNEILAFQWEFPLFSHYAKSPQQETGSVFINRHDIGLVPGLAYCENRPDYFLIPDYIFVSTGGYNYARQIFEDKEVPWADKRPVAFWRGATTGIPERANDWTSLPRAKLCEFARRHDSTGLFDVGFSSVAQLDPSMAGQIRNSGLMADFVHWQEWNKYRYHICIDGNSSPWSNLFQQLLTGSPVLKVESSRGLVQWYYDQLLPWDNYVPVAPDMSDLFDKVSWLRRNDETAEAIGRRGQQLAERLSYERELDRSVPVISAAVSYFSGRAGAVGPYGRVVS